MRDSRTKTPSMVLCGLLAVLLCGVWVVAAAALPADTSAASQGLSSAKLSALAELIGQGRVDGHSTGKASGDRDLISNAGWWDGFAAPPQGQGLRHGSAEGRSQSLVVHGDRLHVHGQFNAAGVQAVQNIAAFDGQQWAGLPGIDPPVFYDLGHTLVVHRGDLVAASYNAAEDLFSVQRYNGETWSTLGSLPSGVVTHLSSVNLGGQEQLFVAIAESGSFSSQSRVYRWWDNGWQIMGRELPHGWVMSLTAREGNLFAAVFYFLNPTIQGRILSLQGDDPNNNWQTMYSSESLFPWSLINHGGNLFAGCLGTDGSDLLLRYVLGGSENWVGQGATVSGSSGHIISMTSWGDRIVLLGDFQVLGSVTSRHVAYWRAGTVHGLGDGLTANVDGQNIHAVGAAVYRGDLYVGGWFTEAGGRESYGIARWRDLDDPLGRPEMVVTAPTTVTVGTAAAITTTVDSYHQVQNVTLAYRTFDNAAYSRLTMQLQPGKSGTYRGTIPAAAVTRHGIQHYVEVQTSLAEFTEPPDADLAASYIGATVGGIVTVPLGRRYELIGIPFVPNGTLTTIFESALGPYDPSQWRLERWNPENSRYQSFPPEPLAVPGHGYYLVLRDPRNLAFSGVSASTVGGRSVSLKPGWTMIATPYEFMIPWSLVPRPAGVENQLIGRSNDAYVTRTVLEPGQGYFVYNAGQTTVTLTIPGHGGAKALDKRPSEGDVETEPLDLPGCDWLIAITPAQGDRQDLVKVVGALTPGAQGPGNLHQPPSLPHDLSVWLEREKHDGVHHLRRDLRHLDGGGVWDLVIRPGSDAGLVRLDFEGIHTVPADLEVVLATPGGSIDLRRAAGLWEGSVRGETRLRLAVGDAELVDQAVGTLPQPYALLPAYPNPSNPSTTVVFTLPRESLTIIEVYDVAGRKVRTLVDEMRGAGRHEVVWDGADGAGRGLSSGMYLLRLRADDFTQTRKLTLVR